MRIYGNWGTFSFEEIIVVHRLAEDFIPGRVQRCPSREYYTRYDIQMNIFIDIIPEMI